MDLATGRMLRPAELFRTGAQAELSRRIQPPSGQSPGSGGSASPNYYSIDKLGLSHPQVESGFIANDGFVSFSLTQQGLDAVWVSRTLDGGGHQDALVRVPYRQIADLLSPRVLTLIRASGATV